MRMVVEAVREKEEEVGLERRAMESGSGQERERGEEWRAEAAGCGILGFLNWVR